MSSALMEVLDLVRTVAPTEGGLIPVGQPAAHSFGPQNLCGIFVANTAVWVGFAGLAVKYLLYRQ
jgi:hypothetical protein